MEKYKGKYRNESNRLKTWDYGSSAHYFVTICTQNRESFFGDVRNGKMILSEIGKIAESEWLKTFEMRPDMNLKMGEFVVMPNHFHAIIGIGENQYNTKNKDGYCRVAMHCDPTKPQPKNQFGPQSKNLASIIRGFKIGVTKNARLIHAHFAWQPNYHDHIIRNNKSYHNISNYILENPLKWNEDTFHPKNNNKK